MLDFDSAPFGLQIFGDQAAVAVVGLVFAAEEAPMVHNFAGDVFFDFTDMHEREEFPFVLCPVATVFSVGVEHLLRGREDGEVDVAGVEDVFKKIFQIAHLAEAGEVGGVVEADVHDAAHAGFAQFFEKLGRGFFGETDGEDGDGVGHFLEEVVVIAFSQR